jgi:hypothetical protein
MGSRRRTARGTTRWRSKTSGSEGSSVILLLCNSMTEPKLNVKRLFRVPNHPWPVVNRGNAIQRVQKIVKPNHVTGLPTHWPKLYYGQGRSNLDLTRTYRNTNVSTLPDGAYLYLIEYNPETNRYHKSFVRVLNKLESGSRHFQLPILNKNRIIIAAGELSKNGSKVLFNLESGTYTRNLVTKTSRYMGSNNYISLVKNALRNARPEYTFQILVPQVPANLANLLKCGNVSFYFGNKTNKKKAELRKAGLNTDSAANLIQQLLNKKTCPVLPRRSPRLKRARANNGRAS